MVQSAFEALTMSKAHFLKILLYCPMSLLHIIAHNSPPTDSVSMSLLHIIAHNSPQTDSVSMTAGLMMSCTLLLIGDHPIQDPSPHLQIFVLSIGTCAMGMQYQITTRCQECR